MNFTISKKIFSEKLALVCKAVSYTTPLPILSGIKLICDDKGIILIGSDSNISIKSFISSGDGLTISENGEIVLDAKYILEIVRKIDSEFVNIETIDGTLIKIFGGTTEYKINGISSNEYPNIMFDVNGDSFDIETELFNNIISKTAFACSEKETRPVLTGVNFKAQNNKLIINATDSYRLAYKTIDLNTRDFNITIPSKYLIEIARSITNEKNIKISIDSQQIYFVLEDTIIKTRLLDDIFPDTSKLIPSSFTQTLKINAKELLDAIDRTSFIRSDGKSIVKMKINSEKVDITSSDNIGSFFGQINVIGFEGQPFEIACSSKYLQEAVKSIENDVITIYFSGELKPMIIKSNEDDSLIQLISPVRTYK